MFVLLHSAFEDRLICLVDYDVKAWRHLDLFGIPKQELKLWRVIALCAPLGKWYDSCLACAIDLHSDALPHQSLGFVKEPQVADLADCMDCAHAFLRMGGSLSPSLCLMFQMLSTLCAPWRF